MEDELKAHLVAAGQAFADGTRLALSTVALRAAKDARFFDRLKNGKGFTAKTYDSVMQWFVDHWPEDALWPERVPRPAPPAKDEAA